jgi:hypothetical protein
MARSLDSLPADLRATVAGELAEDESVTWVEQPRGARFARCAVPLLVLGLLAVLAEVYWLRHVRETGFGLDVVVLAVPFGIVTAGMLLSPLWFLFGARRTAYVVTDRRAIIFLGGFTMSVHSFRPSRLRRLQSRPRPDGSGDLIFTYQIWYAQGGTSLVPRLDNGFYGVPDLSEAERAVRTLAAKKPRR